MKTCLITVVFTFSMAAAYCQADIISDSLLAEACKTIKESRFPDDSSKVAESFNLHIIPVLSVLQDPAFTNTYDYAFVRLQKLCPEFKKYLDDINPPKDDWTPVTTRPVTKLNKIQCRGFLNHKDYYYLDQDSDTIRLSLSQNLWTDHFKDGTYSKLKFNWISNSEFIIAFIESTNKTRSSLSKPGEKYKYELIEKNAAYYLVFLNMPELNVMGTFKIYYH